MNTWSADGAIKWRGIEWNDRGKDKKWIQTNENRKKLELRGPISDKTPDEDNKQMEQVNYRNRERIMTDEKDERDNTETRVKPLQEKGMREATKNNSAPSNQVLLNYLSYEVRYLRNAEKGYRKIMLEGLPD